MGWRCQRTCGALAAARRVKAVVEPGGASTVAARHGEPVGREPRQVALRFFGNLHHCWLRAQLTMITSDLQCR